MKRVEVCGGIASGKTTLALLAPIVGLDPVLEDFAANPFWKQFYGKPQLYSFETEVTFLMQHYSALKSALRSQKNFICDFSLVLDRAYVDVTLEGRQRTTFLTLIDQVYDEVGWPTHLIHLKCDAEVELERVVHRARKGEARVSLEYLRSLNEAVSYHVSGASGSTAITTIDSASIDFANDAATRKREAALLRGL